MLRAVLSHEASHRMNSGQALIAGADFTVTLMFKVVEEGLQNTAGQINDTKMVNGVSAMYADPWR
jgi:hypothetical protein